MFLLLPLFSFLHQCLNLTCFHIVLQYWSLSSYQSFRGSIVNGGGSYIPPQKLQVPTSSDPKEIPPKVPPRRESISPLPARPELPIHLISTTNQVHKPTVLQQQIPTKLASLSKGKEKGFKTKTSHHRAHSAGQETEFKISDYFLFLLREWKHFHKTTEIVY